MSEPWFTEAGATGTISVEYREDGWFVTEPSGVGETKCAFDDAVELDRSAGEQTVEVTASSFRPGTGSSINFLDPPNGNDAGSGGASTNATTESGGSAGSASESHRSSNEEWDLADFRGSGDYVDVEATVDSVFLIQKDEPRTPDVKGELTDDSVLNPVYFVVEHGASHPYLEEGTRFRFENVKDHFYKSEAQVQVLVTQRTRFEEL